jgi:hypothetical protein
MVAIHGKAQRRGLPASTAASCSAHFSGFFMGGFSGKFNHARPIWRFMWLVLLPSGAS